MKALVFLCVLLQPPAPVEPKPVLWHPVTVRGLQTTTRTHVKLSGVYVRRSEIEDDGDYHIIVSESLKSPCTKADIAQGICAVLEVPPYLQGSVPRPRKGDRIDAAGVSRCDLGHGAIIFKRCTWAEIHPVVELRIWKD